MTIQLNSVISPCSVNNTSPVTVTVFAAEVPSAQPEQCTVDVEWDVKAVISIVEGSAPSRVAWYTEEEVKSTTTSSPPSIEYVTDVKPVSSLSRNTMST